ncbi:hypothetical protein DN30_3735 [Vibrio cholerae]|nr:hypothetical protein DN30_3735 [Vibrio cholerae]
MFGGVADQPFRVAHTFHGVVTSINTRTAVDALILQAVTNIDTGWADLHAEIAINTVA